MLGSTTLIFLIGPSFGAFRGSVRVVANSADETAVGGGHSASGITCADHDLTRRSQSPTTG